jgi:hypothetical protein
MGVFSRIRETKVSGSGQYFEPGLYRVRIKGTKLVDSQKDAGKQFFIVETTVIESSCEKILPGVDRSQVIPLGETMSLPNVKAFVAAASGVDPLDEEVNEKVEAHWSKIAGEAVDFEKICDLFVTTNPLQDEEMSLECIEITTQGKKQPFTKHNWEPRTIVD